VLASLLPGLRDLRAPFVSGVLILVSVALLAGGVVDDVTQRDSQSDRLGELVSWIGRPGVVAAASMAAYLVGSLAVTLVREATAYYNRTSIEDLGDASAVRPQLGDIDSDPDPVTGATPPPWMVEPMVVVLREFESETSRLRRGFRLSLFRYDALVSFARSLSERRLLDRVDIESILTELLDSGPRRLRVANADLHADFDRLVSEAELRDVLLLPLPLTTIALLTNLALPVATEVLVLIAVAGLVLALFAQARRHDRDAHSLLLSVLSDHTISTATLDDEGWQR
jgi:hypothetical protein